MIKPFINTENCKCENISMHFVDFVCHNLYRQLDKALTMEFITQKGFLAP